MKRGVRLVCRICLRTAGPPDAGDEAGADARRCGSCGGPVESISDEPEGPSDDGTPLSLALTPESLESPPWVAPLVPAAAVPGPVSPAGLGRFQLRELLGTGGFGLVYQAYDPRLDRMVALKVLKDWRPSGRVMERFFREARAAAQLDHPNIVPLHDAGRDQGRCWIAYQFVEGRTLSRLRDEGAWGRPEDAARLIRDLARALEHAHQRGVFHRDLKPSNILVEPSGRPRLTDFGLARRVAVDATLTVEGAVLGTPAYISPEQAKGQSHTADARSDIYSLGAILYELLCGVRPNDVPSDLPAWRAESLGPVPAARTRNRAVPRALDRICRRALAQDPADRHPDARALADDLDAWLLQSRPYRPAPALGGAVTVALGLLGLAAAYQRWPNLGPTGPTASNAASPGEAPASAARGTTLFTILPSDESPPMKLEVLKRLLAEERARNGRVLVVQRENIIHLPRCPYLRNVRLGDVIEYANAAAASAAGFGPCTLCRPGPAPP